MDEKFNESRGVSCEKVPKSRKKYIYFEVYIIIMEKHKKPRNRNILVRLPEDVIEKSREKAEELDFTRTAYLRLILTRYFREVNK